MWSSEARLNVRQALGSGTEDQALVEMRHCLTKKRLILPNS